MPGCVRVWVRAPVLQGGKQDQIKGGKQDQIQAIILWGITFMPRSNHTFSDSGAAVFL